MLNLKIECFLVFGGRTLLKRPIFNNEDNKKRGLSDLVMIGTSTFGGVVYSLW